MYSLLARMSRSAPDERGLIVHVKGTGWLLVFSKAHRQKYNTYLIVPLLCAIGGVMDTPFTIDLVISKAARTDATAMNNVASATCIPGHCLQNPRPHHILAADSVRTHLLPKPNAMA